MAVSLPELIKPVPSQPEPIVSIPESPFQPVALPAQLLPPRGRTIGGLLGLLLRDRLEARNPGDLFRRVLSSNVFTNLVPGAAPEVERLRGLNRALITRGLSGRERTERARSRLIDLLEEMARRQQARRFFSQLTGIRPGREFIEPQMPRLRRLSRQAEKGRKLGTGLLEGQVGLLQRLLPFPIPSVQLLNELSPTGREELLGMAQAFRVAPEDFLAAIRRLAIATPRGPVTRIVL